MLDLLLLLLLVVALVMGVRYLRDQTKSKGPMDLHLGPVDCPSCGTRLAMVCFPESVKQAIWGGYTRGAELDKYGRRIDAK